MPFQPGQSGNPSGRPKKTDAERAVEELAKQHTQKAMRALAGIMEDEAAPAAARTSAAIYLIDRAHGKPRQTVDANVRGQYWISDTPLSAEEWAAEFAKPDDPADSE